MKQKLLLMVMLGFGIFSYSQLTKLESKTQTLSNLTNRNVISGGDTIWYEDFSAGIPVDWIVFDNTGLNRNWVYTSLAPLAGDPLASSTGGNGYMLFDAYNFNNPPETPYNVMDAIFQTTEIDCSDLETVILRFQNRIRAYGYSPNNFMVEVSTDQTNWESFDMIHFVQLDNFYPTANPEFTEINITNIAAGHSTVYIRFHVVNLSFYYWMVDDIAVVEAPEYDLTIERPRVDWYFNNGGNYSQIPVSQVGPVFFNGQIQNKGSETQYNVFMDVDITNSFGSVFNGDNSFDFLDFWSYDTLSIACYNFPEIPGTYDVTFSTGSSGIIDENPENNSISVEIIVSDSTYSRVKTPNTSVCLDDYNFESEEMWFVGTNYYFLNSDTLKSLSVFIDENSAVGNTITGRVIHQVSPVSNCFIFASTNSYIIQPSDLGNWVNLQFEYVDIEDLIVPANKIITAGIETTGLLVKIGADNSFYHNISVESLVTFDTYNATSTYGDTYYYLAKVPMIDLHLKKTQVFQTLVPNFAHVDCNGNQNGEATAVPFYGQEPYEFVWSNGETSQTITNLESGLYYVTVSDNIGSEVVASVNIMEPDVLEIESNIVQAPYDYCYSSISINVFGGTAPYAFYWDDGNVQQNRTDLCPGWYFLTVTDINNCQVTDSFYIEGVNYYEFSGTVYTFDSLLYEGLVIAYRIEGDDVVAVDYNLVISGVYSFNLMEGEYYLYAIPYPILPYLSTYYGDVIDWENAEILNLNSDTSGLDIHLVPTVTLLSGDASISGSIYVDNISDYESDIYGDNWFGTKDVLLFTVKNIPVILKNSSGDAYKFVLSGNVGQYAFENLPNGTYEVYPEKAGYITYAETIEISDGESVSNINFVVYPNFISGVIEINSITSISNIIVFPNPAESFISVSSKEVINRFTIVSGLGEIVVDKNIESNQFDIDLNSLEYGVYFLRCYLGNQIITRKIIIQK
ncbi:MAG: T9SS type A sorting domain-containing protein [Bacteroidales bacterium]|nr:T9SS type A sorting domain-containing protein [Bacteroidales bacterium]